MRPDRQTLQWSVRMFLLFFAFLSAGQLTSYAQDDSALKSEWQDRIIDAKRRLADAESRLAEVDQKKKDLTSQWGSSGSALPPQEVMDEIKQLDGERAAAAAEVSSIRNEINVVIPEEARKAGVPPGWIREVQ